MNDNHTTGPALVSWADWRDVSAPAGNARVLLDRERIAVQVAGSTLGCDTAFELDADTAEHLAAELADAARDAQADIETGDVRSPWRDEVRVDLGEQGHIRFHVDGADITVTAVRQHHGQTARTATATFPHETAAALADLLNDAATTNHDPDAADDPRDDAAGA